MALVLFLTRLWLALAALAAVIVVFGRTPAGLDLGNWLGTLTLAQRIGFIGGVVVLAVLVGILWLLWHILCQQGRLLLRIEAIEAGLDKARPAQPEAYAALAGLSIGPSAPPFRLESWQAETLTRVSVDLPARLARATNLQAQDQGHEPVLLAYLIVAHHQPEHVGRLIRALHDGGSYFFIHVDAKSDLAAFQAAVAPFDHVAFASNRVLVKWGRFSVVQAVLTLMQMAVTSGHPFRYYILLSGSDYPIKQKRAIGDHFRNSNRQYMRIDRRLTTDPDNTHAHFLKHLPEGRYFGTMTPYHGSMYWSLTADCIHFILDFIEKNPGFLALHQHIFAPDEVFFHTLLKHSPFADAITQDFSAGCYPDHTSHGNHFIDWTGLRRRDSRLVLDERDFDDLLASDALFARKFDQHESSQLLDLLDTSMHFRLTPVTAAAQKSTLAATQPMEAGGRTNAIRDDSAARAQKTRKRPTVGKSRAWGIQTVYLPRENLRFLEEWLAYHSQLGAEYFYLYDNTGSRELLCGNSVAVNGKNKYGIEGDFRLTDDEIADIEAEIFKKYPVTKVKWQPRRNGEIVYGQGAACDHFSDLVQSGWCAFIDMDEFLYSPYAIGDILEGKAMVLLQKKFDDRFRYETALEITKTFAMKTNRWGRKLLINMEHFIKGAQNIHDLNVHRFNEPLIANMEVVRFNHYNHNRNGHEWLLKSYHGLDPNWQPVPFEEVFTERCELARYRATRIDYSSFVPIPLPSPGSVC